jgi:Bcr/CflA subfamily drug resistance transporter
MNSKRVLLLIILLIGSTAQIASDIYSPSLPAIAVNLQTSIQHAQFSMVIYMLGLAVSQFFYGSLSEGFGRRGPLMLGLTVFFIGNLVSLFAPTIAILNLGRLIQGCGAGACSALWRSIFRDSFEGVELAKYGSYLSIFVTFIIPAAPALGGYLQEIFNWRANFAFLALYSVAILLMVFMFLKETSLHHHPDKLKPKFIAQSFKHIILSPVFMGYTFCTFLCYGAFFSWFTIGPVLLIHIVGISPFEFGVLTLVGSAIPTALSAWIYGKLVTQHGTHKMLWCGFIIIFFAGFLMLLGKLIFGINVVVIVAPMILFYFGVTFVWPSVFAGAFGPFGKMAGYAGALYGCIQTSGAVVIGALASYLPNQSQIPLAFVLIITAVLASFVFEKIVRKKEQELALSSNP